MGNQPLVVKGALLSRAVSNLVGLDEDLPACVEKNASGWIVSRTTADTKVTQETTDDN